MDKCPGQDQRFWKPNDIFDVKCPECGASVEFWKDEPKLKCPHCKELVTNPKLDLSCAQWCKYAKECLGTLGAYDTILCRNLIEDIKKLSPNDDKHIENIHRVLNYAEKIQLAQGGDPLIVKAAAILHDTDNDTARDILTKRGVAPEPIEQICRIITTLASGNQIETTEFNIVADAIALADFTNQPADKTLKTPHAKKLAKELSTHQ